VKIERIRTYRLRAALTPAETLAFSQARVGARTADPFREGLAAEPLKRAGAIIEVPQRPGLGLEVDRAVLERHAVTTGEKRR
jgi:L-alanine-DL-glutamate epimerase-like enolase superfamily enzyme